MSIQKFFKEALRWKLAGGATAAGIAAFSDNAGSGLFTPSGGVRSLGKVPNTVVLAGDSITNFCNYVIGPSAIIATVGGYSVQITLANHSLGVGQRCELSASPNIEFNGVWTVATVINSSNFTVLISTPATVTSTTGSIARGNTFGNCGYFGYMSGLRLKLLNNAGVSGDTAATIPGATVPGLGARLQKDVLSYNPQIVVLLIGINDLNGGYSGITPASTFTAIKSIADTIRANGASLVLCTLTPVNSTYPTTAPKIVVLNQLIRDYAETNPGVVLADLHAALVDPSSTTGYVLAANSLDGIHPSATGAKLMAGVISAAISKFGVPAINLVSSYNDAYAQNTASLNTLANPLMQGSGGGGGTNVTGTIPAVWYVSSAGGGSQTVVCSTPARTSSADGDTCGNNFVAVLTAAAANDHMSMQSNMTYGTQFTNGCWLYADLDIGWSGATNLSYVDVVLQVTVGGVAYQAWWGALTDTAKFPSSFRGAIRVPPLLVPAGTITAYQLTISAGCSAAGGVTVQVGRAQLRQAASLTAVN